MAVKFKNSININDQYTFPSVVGTDGQYLSITDAAAGTLDWTNIGDIDGLKSNFVYYDAKNSTGSTIPVGTAVMAVGTDGNSGHILIAPMVADGSVEPKYFIGVTDTAIANGVIGKVVHFGLIDQVNTNAFSDGDVLWCDPNNPGGFTTTEPNAPAVKLASAIVINSSTNGKLLVRVQGNEGLHELHDVNITSVSDNQVLTYDAANGYWKNSPAQTGDGSFSVDTDIFTGNNSTTDFTLSYPVASENNVQVYIDGVYQSKDNYTTSGTTLSFSTAPPLGVSVEAVHIIAIDISPMATNEFVGNGVTTTFTLNQSLSSENRSMVFIEGVYQEKSTYSISGTDIVFTTAPQDGYSIEVMTLGSVIAGGNYVEEIIAGDGISVSRTNADVTITNTITNNNQLTNGAGYALDSDLATEVNARISADTDLANDISTEETARIAGDANLQSQIDTINLDNVDGSGTTNYVSKWTDGDTIGNSVIYDDGTNVGIGVSTNISQKLTLGNNDYLSFHDTSGNSRKTIGLDVSNNVQIASAGAGISNVIINAGGDEAIRVNSGEISFRDSSNNKAFYWDASTARLGLGTTSPNANLDVNLNAQFNKSSADGGFVNILGNNSFINIGADKGGGAVLKYNSNGNLDITPRSGFNTVFTSGNVGIGTSSPIEKLEVAGNVILDALNANLKIKSGVSGTKGDIQWVFNSNSTAYASVGLEYDNRTTDGFLIDSGYPITLDYASGYIRFLNNGNEKMRIDSIGRVGIGTNSPNTPLQVAAVTGTNVWDANLSVLDTSPVAANTGGGIKFGGVYNDSGNISADFAFIRALKETGGNDFSYGMVLGVRRHNQAPVERIRISSAGDVSFRDDSANQAFYWDASTASLGIGTSSPSTKFEVNQGGDNNGITLSNSARGAGRIEWELSGVTNGGHKFIHNNGTDENVMWYSTRAVHSFYTNNAEKMRLESDGDLHVDGDVIAYSTTVSDQRLKDDVQTIDNALDKVSNLRGVSYTWNNGNRKGQKDLGLIAQEVEQVLPELVREKEMPMIDGETYKTVDYEKIVGVLVEAVKELTDKVNKLEAK